MIGKAVYECDSTEAAGPADAAACNYCFVYGRVGVQTVLIAYSYKNMDDNQTPVVPVVPTEEETPVADPVETPEQVPATDQPAEDAPAA